MLKVKWKYNLASFLWPIFLEIKYPIMKKKERNSTVKEK
jgi:hypothetical protein